MGHVQFEVRMARVPGDVWAYLSDRRHEKDWQPGWLEVSVDPPAALRVGTRKTKVRRTPLGVQSLTVEATRVDDANREWNDVVVKGLATGTTGHCQVLADGAGSRVRIKVDTPLQCLARWLAPLLERSSGAVIARGLERLKGLLEGDGVNDEPRSDQPKGGAERMKLFYFVGGPVDGQQDAFFKRLAEVGGSPRGWRLYPHVSQDRRALHVVEANGEAQIDAHLAQFGALYERGPIVEIVPPQG
jgi:Polyketide cyclase / dehydrase and lipid transport